MAREDAIKGMIGLGLDTNGINQALSQINQPGLSEYETALISRERYGMNAVERWGKGANEFTQGLGSLISFPYHYATNEGLRNYTNRNIAEYGRKFIQGETNPVVDFTNAMLSPYGIDVEDIMRNPGKAGKTALIGAAVDPFNATLDAVTINPLPKGAIAKGVERLLPKEGVVNDIRRTLLPTNREKELARVINIANPEEITKRAKVSKELEELSLSGDIEQAVKNLTHGTTAEAKATTKKLKDFIEDINRQMVELGVDANDAKKVAVGQFVLENLDPNRTKNIYLQNVQKAIDSPTLDNIKAIGLDKPSDLTKLIETGNQLYDSGRIFPVSQRGLSFGINQSLVDLSDVGRGLSRERTFGYGTTEQVANNIDRAYGQLYKEIAAARQAENSFQEIAQKFGRQLTPDEAAKIAKHEVIISPTEFKEGIRTLFKEGKQADIGKLAEVLGKNTTTSTLKKYANDLYIVNKSDIKALSRVAKGMDTSSTLGKTVNALQPLVGAFKSSVLTKVPYFFGNRIGNIALSAIGGADYVSALNPKMWKYIPEYLKQSTSFHGLNPGFEASSLTNTYKDTLRGFKRGIENLTGADKTIGERVAGAGETIKRGQELALPIRPFFQTESTFELADRAAVYFNQAKQVARETGESFENVLNKALTDKDLQRDLIGRVNNVLGDYAERSPFVDPTIYGAAGIVFPFHKILTTSKDVMLNQLRDNPLRVQAFSRVPARVMYNEMERERDIGGQPLDNDPRGGLIGKPTFTNRLPAQRIFSDYHPFAAPLEVIQSVTGPEVRQGEGTGLAGAMNVIGGNLNPITGLFNALSGKDQWGNEAIGPNTYKTSGGQLVVIDNMGNRIEQPEPNVLGAFANYIGRNFLPAATFYNQSLGPFIGSLSGKGFYQPTNRAIFGSIGEDQRIPLLIEGNTNKAPILTEGDFARSQLGLKARNVYFPYNPMVGERDMRSIMRKRFIQRQLKERGY